MSEEKIIGKGTWIDKLASELIEREKILGRKLDLIREFRIQIRINCIFR